MAEQPPSGASTITWYPKRSHGDVTCPLCGETSSPSVVVATPERNTGEDVDFVRCSACGSIWPVGIEFVDYPDETRLWDDDAFRYSIHHGLELVSGLERQVELVDRVRRDDSCRFLEVGCNVGILAAYVEATWGAEVEAIEPSVYGEMARAAFGLRVHRGVLDSTLETDHDHFDVIVAIEVIEHVDDPNAFLRELRRRLAPGGAVVVTTPAADALDGDLDDSVTLGALSVRSHRFLFSRERLEAHLIDAGFENVVVVQNEHDLEAFAGEWTAPITRDEAMRRVRDFRDHRAPEFDAPPRAELGLLFDRYLAHRLHDPESGVEIERELEQRLRNVMGIDVHELESAVAAVLAATDLPAYGRVVPFRFGEFLYWRGQRADLSEYERTSMWEAAVVIIDHGVRVDPQNLGPLLPALGPAVVAVSERPAGQFRRELLDAVATSPNEVLLRFVEPPPRTRLMSHARRAAGRLRRSP